MNHQQVKTVNQVLNINNNQIQNQFTPGTIFSNKKLEHMNCIFQGDYQIGGLYIGDVISTIKPGILQSGNIKAILGCSYDKGIFNSQARTDIKLDNIIIDCKDSVEYPLSMHFATAYEFIQNHRKDKKNVLVHCHAGVSRSCAIAISYLIKKLGWSAQQAYKFIKSKRERVKPNLNFWKQLTEYEKQFVPKQRWSTLKDSQFDNPRPPLQINTETKLDVNKRIVDNKLNSPRMPNQINPQSVFNYRQQAFEHKNQQQKYLSPLKTSTQVMDNHIYTPQPKHFNYSSPITSPKNLPWSTSNNYMRTQNRYHNGQYAQNRTQIRNPNYYVHPYEQKHQQIIPEQMQKHSQSIYQQRLFQGVISPKRQPRFQIRKQQYRN